VLASGSSGNCALVATGRTRVLVDAGLSVRELTRRLASIGRQTGEIDAVIVTHEHSDHVAGLARLSRKFNLPVYATWLTAPHLDFGGHQPALQVFQAGSRIPIGDLEIQTFTLPHDAIDPLGLCFEHAGVKIGVVTDLGYVTDSVRFHLRGAHVLLLEANHDLDMLKVGPYPWSVKQRVMGRMGHLSNDGVCDFLMRDLDRSVANLVLGHLSEHNNHPELVRMMACRALERRGLNIPLSIARQKEPSDVFTY
jgi:phosphoribosyl 1,2-cyclic phosphodiesterase